MKNKNYIPTVLVIILSILTTPVILLAHADEKATSEVMFSGLDSEPGKTVSLFHKALKNGDKKLARSLLADSVLIFEGGRVERSADEYAEHHMLADMKYLAVIKTNKLEHHVDVYSDSATSISRSKSTGKYKGKDIDNEGMETIVLAKEVSGWKIVHIHWSN